MAGTFLVTDASNNQVIGSLSFTDGNRLIVFTETSPLQNSTAYNVVMTNGCLAADGSAFAGGTVITFTTRAVIPGPVVLSTIPSDGAIDVDPAAPIQIQMDKAMDTSTITTA